MARPVQVLAGTLVRWCAPGGKALECECPSVLLFQAEISAARCAGRLLMSLTCPPSPPP
jgi:hypothetical protein